MLPSGTTLRAIFYSLVLHLAVGALLFINLDLMPRTVVRPHVDINIVQAVTVDEKQVQQEVERIRETERKKAAEEKKRQDDMERKLAELQKQTAATEQKRKTEEKRLADLERKKAAEQKQREVEQQRLADLKKQKEELEQQQRLEEEKKRKAAEEQRRQEEEKKRKAEEDRKQQAAEAQLKEQLAAEQRARDQVEISRYTSRIQAAIQREFNLTGLPAGLSAVLMIRVMPGGEVVAVQIERSSGNSVFDQRAELAVKRASPLPVPEDTRLFEQMRQIRLPFEP